jgi:hypothetical protein
VIADGPDKSHRHSVTLALTALGGALAIAACGGSAGGARASADPALKLAQCMRAHGIANFPDPGANGEVQIGPGLNPRSPAFQAAQSACAKYAAFKGGPPHMTEAQRLAAFRFAKCVRAHGYPGFPDPSDSVPHGRGTVAVLALRGMVFAFNSSFNPQDPAFHAAAAACGLKLPRPGQGGKANFVP